MAWFGFERKPVKILELTMTGADSSYQLYIDNYYRGVLTKKNEEWSGPDYAKRIRASSSGLLLPLMKNLMLLTIFGM